MITHPTEYAGTTKFLWFFGVVEDLADPLYLGRVRVRCFGWHSDDLAQVPTSALPWAQILMPSTSASVSGIGQSPTGIVSGAWVLGFFLDGNRCQQPMVLGTFHGIPQSLPNIAKGFNDPIGVYPRSSDEADTNRLARTSTEADTHPSLIYKHDNPIENVPTANRYTLSSVAPDKEGEAYQTELWSEPTPRGGATSIYPHNKVTETETGHVFEVDDTPDCRRIHEYHAAGTYREIQNDGTVVQKIIGDRYTIIAKNDNVLISGDCFVTISGDCRLRVDGDLVEEIAGDHHVTVHGSRYTKIVGNDAKEVGGSETTQVNGDTFHRTTKDYNHTVGGEETVNIGKSRTGIIGGADTVFIGGKFNQTASDILQIAVATVNIGAGTIASISGGTQLKLRNLTEIDNAGAGAATVNLKSGADMNITAIGTLTIDAAIIRIKP